MSVIDKLTELRSQIPQEYFDKFVAEINEENIGTNNTNEDILRDFVTSLVNAFDTLKRQHEAAERLVEVVEKMDVFGLDSAEQCSEHWREKRDAALQAYRTDVGEESV